MMRGFAMNVAAIAVLATTACGGNKQEQPPNTVKAQDTAKGSADTPPKR